MKYMRFFLIVAIILSPLVGFQTHAFEEDLFDKIKGAEQPVVVKGDKVEYFHEQKKVKGEGNISITYGDVKLTCDKIVIYTDTKEAICEGNVKIAQPGASFEGDKINYNFSTKRGYAVESNLMAKPFYGRANRIAQEGDKEFGLKKGYITTSDLEKPHYRIEAKEIRIFLDKKVVAKHIFFYVGDVPILYLPLYVQPIGGKYPEVTIVPGRTSDWGYYALTAWRYYFSDDSRGFVHLDYREKKGFAEGIDYQYKTEALGKGITKFYYAHENDDLAIRKSGSKDDRWRVQYRHTIDLPENTACTVELNKISDRDMMKDYLYREYEENPIPDNYILFDTTKQNYAFRLLARKRLNTFFTVVERLPEVKLEVKNQRLWKTNFYYFSENAVTNFIKRYDKEEDLSPEESLRADNFHKFSYVTKLFRFLYVTPFAATRQTFYSRNRWKDTSNLRSIYEGGVGLNTRFYKVFGVNSNFLNLDLHKLRHIVAPSVEFLHRHQPTISPENLYQFDEIDDIERYNGFKLSLENKLQTKRPHGDTARAVDLARLIVSTDYIFRLKKRSFESQGVGRFGDLAFKLELRPYRWLSIDSDMILDRKDHDINSANIDVYFNMGKKFTLGVGHRYESTQYDRTSQFTGEMFYNINDDWKVKVYERYDFASEKLEEQEYTIIRDLHSWVAELSVDIRDGDYTTWLIFRLKAFPEIPIGLFKTTYHRPRPGGRR